jgi:hypothetical protein
LPTNDVAHPARAAHTATFAALPRHQHHLTERVTTAQELGVGADEHVPGEVADDAQVGRGSHADTVTGAPLPYSRRVFTAEAIVIGIIAALVVGLSKTALPGAGLLSVP